MDTLNSTKSIIHRNHYINNNASFFKKISIEIDAFRVNIFRKNAISKNLSHFSHFFFGIINSRHFQMLFP